MLGWLWTRDARFVAEQRLLQGGDKIGRDHRGQSPDQYRASWKPRKNSASAAGVDAARAPRSPGAGFRRQLHGWNDRRAIGTHAANDMATSCSPSAIVTASSSGHFGRGRHASSGLESRAIRLRRLRSPARTGATRQPADFAVNRFVLAWFAKASTSDSTASASLLRERAEGPRFNVAHFSASLPPRDRQVLRATRWASIIHCSVTRPERWRTPMARPTTSAIRLAGKLFIGLDAGSCNRKQVNPATHGKVIAAKLSELGVPRRRAR